MTLVVPLVPAPDPFGTCVRFSGLPQILFLDSSAQGALGRFSFLCADPVAVVRTPGNTDPLEAARALLSPYQRDPLPGLPPFQGGIAGYLGYDWGAELERVRRPPAARLSRSIPDVVLGLYDWVIAWDHLEDKAWIASTGISAAGGAARGRTTAQRRDSRGCRDDWRRLAAPSPTVPDRHPRRPNRISRARTSSRV